MKILNQLANKLFGRNLFHRNAAEIAKKIRGNCKPAIIIYGVTARAGSNYLAQLLGQHARLHLNPRKWLEPRFLGLARDIITAQQRFMKASKIESPLAESDFLAFLGASIIAYLYEGVPASKQILLKTVETQNLRLFFQMFPHEKLILLLRDGRDVVESTLLSWPERLFDQACKNWADNATEILDFEKSAKTSNKAYIIVRYEDVFRDPLQQAARILQRFSLNIKEYPSEKAGDVPIYGSSTIRENGKLHWKPVPRFEGFNPVGRWTAWTAEKKEIFKSIAGEVLVLCGYEKNMNW
jgi:hypothetical protein